MSKGGSLPSHHCILLSRRQRVPTILHLRHLVCLEKLGIQFCTEPGADVIASAAGTADTTVASCDRGVGIVMFAFFLGRPLAPPAREAILLDLASDSAFFTLNGPATHSSNGISCASHHWILKYLRQLVPTMRQILHPDRGLVADLGFGAFDSLP